MHSCEIIKVSLHMCEINFFLKNRCEKRFKKKENTKIIFLLLLTVENRNPVDHQKCKKLKEKPPQKKKERTEKEKT